MVNVKLSASKLNKLKSATKKATAVTLRLSSDKIRDNQSNSPISY